MVEWSIWRTAYGGLHGWSPRGEKAAKVGFDSQRKHTKKKVTEKGKKSKASIANVAKKNAILPHQRPLLLFYHVIL